MEWDEALNWSPHKLVGTGGCPSSNPVPAVQAAKKDNSLHDRQRDNGILHTYTSWGGRVRERYSAIGETGTPVTDHHGTETHCRSTERIGGFSVEYRPSASIGGVPVGKNVSMDSQPLSVEFITSWTPPVT